MDESNLLIEWPGTISQEIMKEIAAWQKAIESNLSHLIIECFAAYRSLLVTYNHQQINAEDLEIELLKLPVSKRKGRARKWQIPVLYDPSVARDLEGYCQAKDISIKQVIKRHTAPLYNIHFFGFLPGFMYLGGLDPKLAHPRKETPDRSIPAGAVAIGGKQTGIYPATSPGGWHVIGSCPIGLFDVSKDPPCPFNAGDQIRFKAVSPKAYEAIRTEVAQGHYQYQKA